MFTVYVYEDSENYEKIAKRVVLAKNPSVYLAIKDSIFILILAAKMLFHIVSDSATVFT